MDGTARLMMGNYPRALAALLVQQHPNVDRQSTPKAPETSAKRPTATGEMDGERSWMVPRQRLRHRRRLEIGQPGPNVQVNQSHQVPAIDSGDAASMAPSRADSGVLFRRPRALPELSHPIDDLCSRFPCLNGSRLYGDCCRMVLSDCSISAGCR
jgi:hypothetical protein